MTETRRATGDDVRRMTRLAWPALMENLLSTAVQFIDTAMVGALGAAATAAVAVNTTPVWLCGGLVTALGVGGTALVARMVGAEDQNGAEEACRQVLLGILALSTALCVAALLLAGRIPVWMGADAALHADATAYMRIIALAFIPHFTGMALGAVLRGAGDTRTPMLVAAGTNALNVIGNLLLIFQTRMVTIGSLSFQLWGAGLGVRGAAISTAVSTALGGMVMVLLMRRKKSRLQLKLAKLRPDGLILRRILRVGLPTAAERLTINIGQLMFVGMIAALGTAQLAAHHLAITVESLSYMPGYAFGAAATTLVGQSIGAQDVPAAKTRGGLTIATGVVAMMGIGVAMYLLAPWLIALLTPDAAVREIGADLIRICALEQPFMALSIIGASALRGAGDTKVPFYVALAGMWGVRLVLTTVFIGLGMGVRGAWYAMVVDIGIRGVLMGLRFARGKWRLARV